MQSAKRPPARPKFATQTSSSTNADANAGALTEDDFEAAFDEHVSVKNEPIISSGTNVANEMRKINATLCNKNIDWEHRMDALKLLRIFIKRRLPEQYPEEFFGELRTMDPAMKAAVEDLRSQIVREACITLAYMAREITSSNRNSSIPKFEHLALSVIPSLLNAAPKSAKIMSTSAVVAVRFIIRYVHLPGLITLLCAPLTDKKSKENKSPVIRKVCCEFIALLLNEWQRRELGNDDNIHLIADAVTRGINDADKDARAFARDAFIAFHGLCPNEAETLVLRTLDVTKRKMLEGQISQSSSHSSLSHHTMSVAATAGSQRKPLTGRPPLSRENTGNGGVRRALGFNGSISGSSASSSALPTAAGAVSSSSSSNAVPASGIKVPVSKSAHRLRAPTDANGNAAAHRQQPQAPPMLRQASGIGKQQLQQHQAQQPHDGSDLSDHHLLAASSSPYGRSTSAVDPVAAQRAKARADYSKLNRGGLLFRQQKSAINYAVPNNSVAAGTTSNGTNSSSSSSIACGSIKTPPNSAAKSGNPNSPNSNSSAPVHLPAVLRETSYSSTSTNSSAKRPPRRVAQSQPSSRSASPHRNSQLPQQQLRLSGAPAMRASPGSGSKIPVLHASPNVLANATPLNHSKIMTPSQNAANQSLYLIDLSSPMPNSNTMGGYKNNYQTPNSMPNRLLFSHLRAASGGGGASLQKMPQFLQNNGVIDADFVENTYQHHNRTLNGGEGDEVDAESNNIADENDDTTNNSNNSSLTSANGTNNGDLISRRLTNAVNRLNDTNNSTDDIKREAMSDIRLMFKQRSADWPAIWDVHFDKVLYALMTVVKGRSGGMSSPTSGDTGDGGLMMDENVDYELRTRALSLLAAMAQLQPNRMEKYAEYVIVEVLEARCVVEPKAGIETRRAFDALNKHVEECALQVGLALSFKRVIQILSPLIKSTNFPLNESAIKMFGNVIRNIPAEQVRVCIDNHQELVKMLVKQFDEGQQISIRKESVFTLAYLVHKLGKDYFFNLPCVAGLNDSRKHLIKLYVGKTSSLPSSGGGGPNDSILEAAAPAAGVVAGAAE